MEFAYNDFGVAQTALVMGDNITYELLSERASSWEKLFNAEQASHGFSGFISPRSENAVWLDYDPAKFYGPWTNFFYEGNSWIYSLFVPHGFDRPTERCGGEEQMVERPVYGFDNELIDPANEPG